jgi:hypothetical protein
MPMNEKELQAFDDLKRQCNFLYQKLGYPTWEAHKRQFADEASLRAHESNLASGGRSR